MSSFSSSFTRRQKDYRRNERHNDLLVLRHQSSDSRSIPQVCGLEETHAHAQERSALRNIGFWVVRTRWLSSLLVCFWQNVEGAGEVHWVSWWHLRQSWQVRQHEEELWKCWRQHGESIWGEQKWSNGVSERDKTKLLKNPTVYY